MWRQDIFRRSPKEKNSEKHFVNTKDQQLSLSQIRKAHPILLKD